MDVSVRLDPQGSAVPVGDIELRTPGLEGVATSLSTTAAGLRAEGISAPTLERLLDQSDVSTQTVVKIEETRVVGVPSDISTRSARHGDEAIELLAPAPQSGWGQMVLSKDESDVLAWHFAEDDRGQLVTRGGGQRIYRIPRRVPASGSRSEVTRGFLGWAGKKLLRVLAFKTAGRLIGKAAERFAQRWELTDGHRPYALRKLNRGDYRMVPPAGVSVDWSELRRGKALFVVHGTLSRAHTEFSKVPPEFVRALDQRYDGRVFAFDHPTLSRTPKENVDELLSHVPRGVNLDVDVICISRGGLVARELESRLFLSTGSSQLRVDRIIFIGAPNRGTILADGNHWNDFIDIYTNLLNLVPDNPVTGLLDALITLAKLIAVNALGGLTGLQAMRPDGAYLNELNERMVGGGRYFAVTSNFEPVERSGFRDYVRDVVIDQVFGAPNDLIVPTDGVYASNGSPLFPIADPLLFAPPDGVGHSGYLRNPRVRERILQWLSN